MPVPSRVRITISLAKEIADQIDELVDGLRIRNRSHAVETLVTDSLDLAQIRQAVIMAGGEHAVKRIPAIKSVLKTLQKAGIFELTVAVGYLGEAIRKELGNGEELGLKIHYLESDNGTGGVLLQMKNQLKRTFLVVNLEKAVEVDIKSLVKFHREHRPLATIATTSLKDLHGIYVLEPKVLHYLPSGFCMLEEEIFHELSRLGKLISYPVLTEK